MQGGYMREMTIAEASPVLRATFAQAQKSKCSREKKGVGIFNGEVMVAGASRILMSGNNLCLCRGECVMVNENYRNCPSNHVVRPAIRLAAAKERSLKGLILCKISIDASEFMIPSEICCKACEEMIISAGLDVILWDVRRKICCLFGSDELAKGQHVHVRSCIPGHNEYFSIASM